jgi:deoxyribodipyrimidine photo-lyase
MIHAERIQVLADRAAARGRYVLYWMQASQRASGNHALEHAIRLANERGEPLVVLFGLTTRYPEANLRHYAFMLEGLRETQEALRQRGIRMVVRRRSPEKAAVAAARDASVLVTDRGYLRIQKRWRRYVAERAPCPVIQVESDAVVPVDTVSQKEEYAAATIRPKIHRQLAAFLVPLEETDPDRDSLGLDVEGVDLDDLDGLLRKLRVARRVAPVPAFRGGAVEAERRLSVFIREKLEHYADRRNDPGLDIYSDLSPYLHFGQVSPLAVALRIDACGAPKAATDAFLEELIVRRELSLNFVRRNPDYDSYRCLPAWAQATLDAHRDDAREYVYTREELEAGATHDPYWNAAQREMVLGGKMHNYMRMYWGKKILEWSAAPDDAFETALYLNNRYELDGRDPNAFAGVAWCFGKHDRPWGERAIFGKTRYMSAGGLKRKFDMDAYLKKVEALHSFPSALVADAKARPKRHSLFPNGSPCHPQIETKGRPASDRPSMG